MAIPRRLIEEMARMKASVADSVTKVAVAFGRESTICVAAGALERRPSSVRALREAVEGLDPNDFVNCVYWTLVKRVPNMARPSVALNWRMPALRPEAPPLFSGGTSLKREMLLGESVMGAPMPKGIKAKSKWGIFSWLMKNKNITRPTRMRP